MPLSFGMYLVAVVAFAVLPFLFFLPHVREAIIAKLAIIVKSAFFYGALFVAGLMMWLVF